MVSLNRRRLLLTFASLSWLGLRRATARGATMSDVDSCSQPAATCDPNAPYEILLKLRRKAPLPSLEQRPSKPMSRADMAAHYGATQPDIDLVVKVLKKLGLSTVRTDAATRSVVMSGPLSAMETAFSVKLSEFNDPNCRDRAEFMKRIKIPLELKQIVKGVFGLIKNPCSIGGDTGQPDPIQPTGPLLSPSQLAKRYQFPPGDGHGQTVGLLEFGGGYSPQDLAAYCAIIQNTAEPLIPTVKCFSVDGTTNGDLPVTAGEATLDVEVIAGFCPRASIVLYMTRMTDRGWIEGVDAVVRDEKNAPSVLSISWSGAEHWCLYTEPMMKQVNESLQELALLGVTVVAAAGDTGAGGSIFDDEQTGCPTQLRVDFPASSPYVLAVGGTTIPINGGNGQDIVWNNSNCASGQVSTSDDDPGAATGGGVSSYFRLPSWQTSVAIPYADGSGRRGRCVPDVAANADWLISPYWLYIGGIRDFADGGTSAATPLWAALILRINALRASGDPVGYITPVLYGSRKQGNGTVGSATCTDVLQGNNRNVKTSAGLLGYDAQSGYDAVCGWGTPNGMALLQELP